MIRAMIRAYAGRNPMTIRQLAEITTILRSISARKVDNPTPRPVELFQFTISS